MSGSYYVGIDIGGTFTDVVVFEPSSKKIKILKLSSTPESPERAVIDSLSSINLDPSSIAVITHASTIATNALLTRTGLAKVGLITNKGFRDVLEIARQRRSEIYSLTFSRPEPLAQRKNRYTISGRISYKGEETEPVNPEELARVKEKMKKENIESVAVSLLNSYVNPAHEKHVGDFFRDFDGTVFLSSDVNPEFREYERTSTVVVNAALAPLVSAYLNRLRSKFNEIGIRSQFYIMSSNGGLNTADYAANVPISVIESGPSAGVLASAYVSKMLSLENVITFDMGGTTAKAGTIIGGKPDTSSEFEAAGKTHSGRSIKGSGYSVRYPFIDLAEVSAGGGTIAWIDEGKSLRVGPKSAGADPGPAAYNRGGTEPTITDANLVLGKLNPDHLLGGGMKIHKNIAEDAVRKRISDPLGMDVVTASQGIVKLINNAMAKALSIVSIERGRDPRDFTMMAFGGAGPIHACDLASEMGITTIVIPPNPGLFSAYGLLTVDVARPFSRSVIGLGMDGIEKEFVSLRHEAAKSLESEDMVNIRTEDYVDMQYVGQSFVITVPFSKDSDPFELFRKEHAKLYGYSSDDPIEIINAKVIANSEVPKIELKEGVKGEMSSEIDHRKVFFDGKFIETPVMRREEIPVGFEGEGPCIIEGYDSTLVVNPQWKWSVDKYLDIILRRL